MNAATALADAIRRNDPIPFPLHVLLLAASQGQRLGMAMRLRKSPVQVNAQVVSYGNITAGGVGKTPAVIARAQQEIQAGRQTAVVTRGYGAPARRGVQVWTPTPGQTAPVDQFGDEAALISARIPEVWLVRSADRVAGARAAMDRGCDVVLLDDGYQAVALARDENIVMIDAANPFGNGYLVPRGLLREPLSALARATSIVITRCDQAPERIPEILKTVQRHAPHAPVQLTRHSPTHLWRVSDRKRIPLNFLHNASVRMVCGIGNPEAFRHTLEGLGAAVVEQCRLRDHAPVPPELLRHDAPTLITEKDAMRLTAPPPDNVYALAIELVPAELAG